MVSVIIPSHNNILTIKKAVDSVLAQTCRDIEIIIVDNGSEKPLSFGDLYSDDLDDKSASMDCEDGYDTYNSFARELLDDNRFKIIAYSVGLGAAAARNVGVGLASGEYIAFLDADDYWAEDKLDKQLKVMNKYQHNGEKPVICFTGREIVDVYGTDTGRYVGCCKVVDYNRLLRTNQINCSSVLMRTETAKKNPFPLPEDMTGTTKEFHEDYALWLSILKQGGFAAGINRPLLYYRRSPKSKSGNKINSAFMNYRVYEYLGLGPFKRLACMFSYAINGIKKTYG